MRNIFKEISHIVGKQIVSERKCKFLILFVASALIMLLYLPLASAESILGSADDFAVLAYSGITNSGPTTITGDVGSFPTASATLPVGITLTGTYYSNTPPVGTAKTDLSTAYTGLNGMAPTQTLPSAQLGGLNLTYGVYNFKDAPPTVLLDGTLTLDAQGMNNAYWVFQIPAIFTDTGNVVVLNPGSNDGVFFVVGSSASIAGNMEGNILALSSITFGTGATLLNGRALAENGDVTLLSNTISNVCTNPAGLGFNGGLEYEMTNGTTVVPIGPSSVPEPATMLLLGLGLMGLAGVRRKIKK